MKRNFLPDLEHFQKYHDNSLDENDFKKIKRYYGLAVPALLGEAFAVLRGFKMTHTERSSLTYLGGITGLFDDFFDKIQTNENHILSLIKDEQVEIRGSNEELFITLYRKALSFSNHKELIIKYFLEVYDAQVESKKQKNHSTSRDEIRDITNRKGGISLPFYRVAMDHLLESKEAEIIFVMGGLLQLENDIFDIYKDHLQKIKTLATTERNMQNLLDEYSSRTDKFIKSVSQLHYPDKNQKRFIQLILFVIARGFVALRQLMNNQMRNQQEFDINEYTRQELVCDMNKPFNFLLSSHYFAKTYQVHTKRKTGR